MFHESPTFTEPFTVSEGPYRISAGKAPPEEYVSIGDAACQLTVKKFSLACSYYEELGVPKREFLRILRMTDDEAKEELAEPFRY
jgi:hypothetical protein